MNEKEKAKQCQSNLLDQKIDEDGVTSQDAYEFLKTWESKGDNQSIPVSEMCADYANHVLRKEREELKRLVNSVGEWSALAIDRKQDLDEANKKIEELEILFIKSVDCGERYDKEVNQKYLELTK